MGLITEKTMRLSFQKHETKNVVDFDQFKKLLISIGMCTEIELKRGNRLFIPSLINSSIFNFTKGRSTEEVLDDYKDYLKYSLVFGEDKSFASTGVIEAFLVQFYTNNELEELR